MFLFLNMTLLVIHVHITCNYNIPTCTWRLHFTQVSVHFFFAQGHKSIFLFILSSCDSTVSLMNLCAELGLSVCVCVLKHPVLLPSCPTCHCAPQNHEPLRDNDNDSDLILNEGDLTLTYGDTAITANGASSSSGPEGSGGSWGVNGKRSDSTSEDALERELDTREHELLSRGTRLVFPMEDHAWPRLSNLKPRLPALHTSTFLAHWSIWPPTTPPKISCRGSEHSREQKDGDQDGLFSRETEAT